MTNIFNAAEIIDMGIEKEKKRRDFYALVAKKFKDKEMHELFTRLEGWEDEHIKKFTEIRASVEDLEIAGSYQGEFEAYIKSVVDDILYKQVSPEWFARNVKSELTAIKYGIGFEKDAILFFDELLRYMMPPYEEKVRMLIQEEKKHIIYLTEMRRKYE
ncbi:MAG: ferritin family protein [Candidatus Omnitrophota bacterium]